MPGAAGRPLTDDHKRKMAEGRRRAAELRKSRPETGPKRPPLWPTGLDKKKATLILRSGISGADALAAAVAPTIWNPGHPDLGDQLTDVEIDLLAAALSTEAERHPRVLRLLAEIMRYGEQAGILGVLLLIAAPRLARRNLLPRWMVEIIRNMLRASEESPPARGEIVEIRPSSDGQPERTAQAE